MDDKRQRIDDLAVQQYIQLYQLGFHVVAQLIVEGRIATGTGFQHIEEIVNDLIQRQYIVERYTGIVQVLHIHKHATAVLTEFHNISHEVCRCQNFRLDHRLFRLGNYCRVGIIGGVVDILHLAVCQCDTVNNRRRCGNQIQVVLPFQTLLDDLHVEQSQESAAETKAQRNGGLRFKGKGRIVQLQFFQRIPEITVLCAVCRIDTGEYHRVDLAVTRQRLCTGTVSVCNRIAHTGVSDALDGCGKIADFAGTQHALIHQRVGGHIASLHDGKFRAGRHQLNGIADLYRTLFYPDIDDNALVCVIVAVEDQRLERCIRVALWCRDVRHDLLHDRLNVDACLCRDTGCILCRNADHIFDLLADTVRVSRRQVDLVDYRHDLQVMLNGKVCICQRLRLDSLGGVYHQNRTLTGSKAAGDLIVKVNVSRRVDQIEHIGLAVLGTIIQPNCTSLNGDATFPFNIHIVQDLVFHITLGNRIGLFQDTVSQS